MFLKIRCFDYLLTSALGSQWGRQGLGGHPSRASYAGPETLDFWPTPLLFPAFTKVGSSLCKCQGQRTLLWKLGCQETHVADGRKALESVSRKGEVIYKSQLGVGPGKSRPSAMISYCPEKNWKRGPHILHHWSSRPQAEEEDTSPARACPGGRCPIVWEGKWPHAVVSGPTNSISGSRGWMPRLTVSGSKRHELMGMGQNQQSLGSKGW